MIQIKLDVTPPHFEPGERIAGRVHWQELHSRDTVVEVRLSWATTGKGDRDSASLETKSFPLKPGEGSAAFEFLAPQFPYSFSGKLISLVWHIEATVDFSRQSTALQIVIAPNRKEVLLYESAAP